MYAVIETGGKQYRVEVGTELEVELLDVEPGQSITLERVLLVADGAEAAVGTPVVDGAAVEAEVLGATRGDKVIAFKYRPKARRRVKKGHRQELTVLRINDIRFGGKSAAELAPKQTKAESRKALEEAAARQAADDAALAAKLQVAAETAEPAAPKAKAEPKAKAAKAADAGSEAEVAAEAAAAPEAEAAASTGSARGFVIFEEAGEWRWRLVASNGEPVAVSEQGFSSKSGVVRTLDVVRRNVAEAEGHTEATDDEKAGQGFEIYEDSGEWRWRLRASNGEVVAESEQGFSSKSGVVRSLDVVRRNVAAAEGHTEPDATATTTDAAPKRSRTKKDA
jgi:large subunit ribosomal protein L21